MTYLDLLVGSTCPPAADRSGRQLIVVDGDVGGGQVLRNGFALAALAQQPLRINNIRAARQPPGLLDGHLTSIEMLASLCNAKLEGNKVGSMQITFWPGDFNEGRLDLDTGTDSSLSLLAQIILPCLLVTPAPTTLVGIGGTDVAFSPPFDELWAVFVPTVARFGVDATLTLQ
eukprot:EG_transcript_35252